MSSFFCLCVGNGCIKFSGGSHGLTRFSVAPCLGGRNRRGAMTMRICHRSSNSFLRDRSVFHLPNVFHAITLITGPRIRMESVGTVPSLSRACDRTALRVATRLRGLSGGTVGNCALRCSLCTGHLCSSSGSLVRNIATSAPLMKGLGSGKRVILRAALSTTGGIGL